LNTTRTCTQCGADLPGSVPAGVCPACGAPVALPAAALGPALDPEAPTTVGDATDALGPALLAAAPAASCPQRPPPRFGDYELIEEIARGGMGIVYKARQLSLNRVVAVKVILAGPFATPEFVQRFRTEAEAAANLQHPSIVAIHDVGEYEGRHYFSMDYVEGKNLADWARTHPVSSREAAELVKTIAGAVHFAHQRGTLHRDLKPQNVLVDPAGHPRITDFGLAKQLQRESDLTLTGQVLGSPGYLPPEQAGGHHELVGPPSDVYSLGAILYFLLTGQPPFAGPNPLETLRLVSDTEPVSPATLNPMTPAALETICLKCLQKRPERRYATARDLAADLERFLKHEPIQARPASWSERVEGWARRHPWTITGAASVAMLALIGFTYGLWQENLFLAWKLAHPRGVPPAGRYVVDSATSGMVILYICLFVGIVPLEDLRLRRSRGDSLGRRQLLAYGAFGALEMGLAIGLVVQWIKAYVWGFQHYWRWPQMALLAPLCLAWFGTILCWKAARGQSPQGLAPGGSGRRTAGAAPRHDQRRILLFTALAALVLMGPSDWLTPEILYWKFVFFFSAVACAMVVGSAGCGRGADSELRPFWLFLTVASACFALELISKLVAMFSGRAALLSVLVGIVAGALFLAGLRPRK